MRDTWLYARWSLPWSPCICDVLYAVDIRRATGDKARLNPPNQLCFTVLATLPLYIGYRSPYIFAGSTCMHTARTYSYVRFARVSARATLSPGIRAHGCVKRKHPRGSDIGVPPALWCRWFRSERSSFTSQEFYPRRGAPRRLLSANAIVLLHVRIARKTIVANAYAQL